MATPVGTIKTTGAKPVGTIGPAPQQLRAGTGDWLSDIKQDAANIFLPERFAAEIAQKQNPGSEIYQDDDGNWILRRADGSEHYLNAPGLGVQDALNVAGALALPGAAGAVGGAIMPTAALAARGLSISSPMMAGMGAGAAYSAAEQTAGAALTDQDASLYDIGMGALFGGVVPGLQKYGGKGLDKLADVTNTPALRNPVKYLMEDFMSLNTPAGELTDTAKSALDAAGIKWQNFTPEQIAIANKTVMDNLGMAPKPQGRAAGMATIGIDNPTPGMLSQRPDIILDESKGLDRAAREAAILELQNVGNRLAPPDNLEGMGRQLLDLHNADRRAVAESFDTARRASEGARVSPADLDTLRTRMLTDLERDLSDDQIAAAMANFPTMKTAQTQSILGPDGKPISTFEVVDPNEIPKTIRKLYEWRRDHLGVDATGNAKASFDAEMERWINDGLASDLSAEGIQAWQAANKQMREFAITWRSGDTLDRLIALDKQGYATRLDFEAAANTLWNASETGFLSKPGLRRDIQKLREVLGPDSQEFRTMADALAYKALALESGFKRGQRQGELKVNGVNMMNQWLKVKNRAGDVLEDLYPPGTLDAFDNFIEYARLMDTKIKSEATLKGDGISEAFAHILKRAANATFRFSRAGLQEASEVTREKGAERALREFYGDIYLPRGGGVPKIAAGQATEAVWEEEFDDWLRDLGYDIPGGPEPLQIEILNGIAQ